MGINVIMTYLLAVHFIADYYLQTDNLAKRKKSSITAVLLHGLIYAAATLLMTLPFIIEGNLYVAVGIMVISHLLIDLIKYFEKVHIRKLTEGVSYAVDQILHIAVIWALARTYSINLGIALASHLQMILMIIIVCKPVNITFKALFGHLKPGDEDDMRAGKLIGNIERILVGLLLTMGQFAAIGLVFTAKSITRYDRISKDKQFAEYYLLGTLFSMLAVMAVYVCIYRYNWGMI